MDESNYMFVDLLKPMSHMDSEAGSSLCWIWSDGVRRSQFFLHVFRAS